MKTQKNQTGKNVILGGFLSHPLFYSGMKSCIENLSGQETQIVQVPPPLWYALFLPRGWIPILKRLERTLREMQNSTARLKVTLIGHSIGGVLGLLYLLSPSGNGPKWTQYQAIGHLVTLGSPHRNQRRWLHGGRISRLVEKCGGANAIRHHVRLTCIAGKAVFGNKHGTASEKRAYAVYKAIGGQGNVWGDGIIPVTSALLPEANPILIDHLVHFPPSVHPWYGSPEIVSQWWKMIQAA